jgi:RHS repeat-associated protein
MTKDPSKQTTITYNHLNLPNRVQFGTNQDDRIDYTYTATGRKLRKEVNHSRNIDSQTDYSGAFLYEDGQLISIFTPAGRVLPMANNSWQYEYNLTDHLGNVRAVFAVNQQEQAVLQQKTDYYPFGMVMNQTNPGPGPENKLLYNSKEIQDDVVAGKKLDWYDYGARFYDPQIARFHSVDRFAEEFNNWSPYHYANNNPISNIDFNGDSTVVVTGANNTYEVRGGSPTDSKGLYLLNDNGEVTLIGQTLTPYSFFDDDNNAVVGAIIDPNSSEGTDFLGELITDNPGLVEYMINARSGEDYKYDFKERGLSESEQPPQQHRYRGSKMVDGVYGSARDFGNMGAGMVASRKGLSWFMARVGFDAYDSYKSGSIGVEGRPSQAAQRLGFIIGKSLRKTDKEQ